MKEIYAYEFNFIINVVLPLVAFLGGIVYSHYCLYVSKKSNRNIKKTKI